MSFSDWKEGINSLHAKVSPIPLYDISESISVDGHSIQVTIGYTVEVHIGSQRHDWSRVSKSGLSQYYTKAKDEFNSILDSLTTQAEKHQKAVSALMKVVTSGEVADAVIARMKGEHADDLTMLQRVVEKKLDILLEGVEDVFTETEAESTGLFRPLQSVSVSFMDVEGNLLTLSADTDWIEFAWGKLSTRINTSRGYRTRNYDRRELLSFLLAYNKIDTKIKKFILATVSFNNALEGE